MDSLLQKRYPVYTGAEQYLFFCFSDADEKRVRPLLERLYARGCRVWYTTGRPANVEERRQREERMKSAALSVFYLSDAAREDTDMKGAALVCQERGAALLCIDADEGDSGLSFGLTEQVRHLKARDYRSAAELEEALVRSEGFSQELIGPDRIAPPSPLKKIALTLAAVSVLLLALALLGGRLFGWFAPPIEESDAVVITDTALRGAVRAAVGGGAITEENVAALTTLRLKELPADEEELRKLPALERLEIPQSEAADSLRLLDEGYTVVLYGGRGK